MSLATPTSASMAVPLPDDSLEVRLRLARGLAFEALLDAAEASGSDLHPLLALTDLCARKAARGESLRPWADLIAREQAEVVTP